MFSDKQVGLIWIGLLIVYMILQFGTRHLAKLPPLAMVLQGLLAAGALFLLVRVLDSAARLALCISASISLGLLVLFFLAILQSNLKIWNRQGAFDPAHYAPWRVTTADGVEIVGVLARSGHPQAVVISHGVANLMTGRQIVALADVLAERFDVYVFDYRGFGESGGGSTFGIHEVQDLKAVLDYVAGKGYEQIAVIGDSMGGMVSVLMVAEYKNVDAIISVASPASFEGMTGLRAALLRRVINHWLVQAIYEMGSQVQLAPDFVPIEPYKVTGDLSPIPYLVIHGTKDPLVDVANAEQLYQAALEPKELWLYQGGGHSVTDLGEEFGDQFRYRISDWLNEQLVPAAAGEALP